MTYEDLQASEGLIEGLSYEPKLISTASWLINGQPLSLGEYELDYDQLLEYMDLRYGIGRVVVNAALDIAEARIVECLEEAKFYRTKM